MGTRFESAYRETIKIANDSIEKRADKIGLIRT